MKPEPIAHIGRGDGQALCSASVTAVRSSGRQCVRCARISSERKRIERQRRKEADYRARMAGERRP